MIQIDRNRVADACIIWIKSNLMIFGLMILIRLLFTIALYFRLAIDFLGITTILGGIRFDMILSGSIAVTTFLPIIL